MESLTPEVMFCISMGKVLLKVDRLVHQVIALVELFFFVERLLCGLRREELVGVLL